MQWQWHDKTLENSLEQMRNIVRSYSQGVKRGGEDAPETEERGLLSSSAWFLKHLISLLFALAPPVLRH